MIGTSSKPGPDPDRLKIDDPDWEKSVDKAIGKKRPDGGWPKNDKPPRDEQGGGGEAQD